MRLYMVVCFLIINVSCVSTQIKHLQDEKIVSFVLQSEYGSDGYTVVKPRAIADVSYLGGESPSSRRCQWVSDQLENIKMDLCSLIDKLIKKTKTIHFSPSIQIKNPDI